MIWIANVLVALVAVLHVYFLVLEMFLWTKPLGLKTFRNTPEKAQESAVLAANQGLYNGFLAAGLIWGLLQPVTRLCLPDQGVLPALRDRRRRLWRRNRQPQDSLRSGGAGGTRADPALARVSFLVMPGLCSASTSTLCVDKSVDGTVALRPAMTKRGFASAGGRVKRA